MASKRRFSHRASGSSTTARNHSSPCGNISVFQRFLRLSQACRGETSSFSIKWRERCVFRTCATIVTRSDSAAMVCGSPPPLTPPPCDRDARDANFLLSFPFLFVPSLPWQMRIGFGSRKTKTVFLAHRVLKRSRAFADVAVVMLELLHHTHQRLRHLY